MKDLSVAIAAAEAPRTFVGDLRASVGDYLQLSKARIVIMVLITTTAGFLIGAPRGSFLVLINTLIGTALLAGGTNALNQVIEREHDAKMRRTKNRPLPAGRITPRRALVFASGIALAGALQLGFAVNWLTSLLGVLTLITYIGMYTPLKRISTICTLVGAVPGAIPPLMGWTAATGRIALPGLIVFAILFFWQLPHFMAISWIYREDYGRAGFVMTAVRDVDGAATSRQAIFFSFALLAAAIAPWFAGISGAAYLALALVAGTGMIALSIRFFFDRSTRAAFQLFMSSNLYLIVVMVALVIAAR